MLYLKNCEDLLTQKVKRYENPFPTVTLKITLTQTLNLTSGLEISPTELNSLYEDLYDLGLMMQTTDSMKLFDNGFRPWPHVYKAGRRSQRFYSRIDANLGALTLTLTHT